MALRFAHLTGGAAELYIHMQADHDLDAARQRLSDELESPPARLFSESPNPGILRVKDCRWLIICCKPRCHLHPSAASGFSHTGASDAQGRLFPAAAGRQPIGYAC
jgi:hypothetical protein